MPPTAIQRHLASLLRCDRCPRMHKPVVVGRPVDSRIMLVGQAPGDREPRLGRPFAWTAGRTLFRWFSGALGWTEDEVRDRIYFAAVCRCFPGKLPKGGDRVPDPGRDRGLRPLAGTRVRAPPDRARDPGRQACDRAFPRARAAEGTCRPELPRAPVRPRGGLHPAPASLGGIALAPDGARQHAALGAGSASSRRPSRRRFSFLDARVRLCTLIGHVIPSAARRVVRPGLRPPCSFTPSARSCPQTTSTSSRRHGPTPRNRTPASATSWSGRAKGPLLMPGDLVMVHYMAKLLNGKVFDQHHDDKHPFTFRVDRGIVIDGWDQILQLMSVRRQVDRHRPTRSSPMAGRVAHPWSRATRRSSSRSRSLGSRRIPDHFACRAASV
jgi:hypothetical protein